MGNRAVITTENAGPDDIGVYLHWNGGPESVLAFLEVAKRLEMRNPCDDPEYGWARLCQVVGNFFGGSTSVGVGRLGRLDTDGDNGTYYINREWEVVEHRRIGDQRKAVEDLTADDLEKYTAVVADCMAQYRKAKYGYYELAISEKCATPTAKGKVKQC